jgi:hypothetical protein
MERTMLPRRQQRSILPLRCGLLGVLLLLAGVLVERQLQVRAFSFLPLAGNHRHRPHWRASVGRTWSAPPPSSPGEFVSADRDPEGGDDDDDDDDDDDEDDEPVAPGKMRVSEIKAELELRGIRYADCFDKDALVDRLETARATGRADPTILEQFNKQALERTFAEQKVAIRDEDIAQATANDGTLPGGMTPETFKKLTSNPEIMQLLSSTKMQEAMKLMMTAGRDGLEQKLRDDPDLQETVRKLDQVLRSAQ